MEIEHYNDKMLPPEQAVSLLAKNGVHVTTEEAKDVLELMYFLVNLSVDQIIEEEKHPPTT